MYAQLILTIVLICVVMFFAYKIIIKPMLKSCVDDEDTCKTIKELDAEIEQLTKSKEELLCKEQSIEVLKEQKRIDNDLEKVNKIRNRLKS